MFLAWGRIVVAHRHLVLIVSTIALAVAIGLMATTSPIFQPNAFIEDSAESAVVDRQMTADFGHGEDTLVFIIDAGAPVTDPAVQARIQQVTDLLVGNPGVIRMLSAASTGSPDFISTSGTSTYVVAYLNRDGEDHAIALADALRARGQAQGLAVSATGGAIVNDDVNSAIESGLLRAETISIPLTIIFLVLIFGSVIAAGLPLVTGAIGIVVTLALTFVLSQVTDQSVFAINIVTMLGLGLGVDYSLFMVSRFREEIQRRPIDDAAAVTVGTVGKAVFFSAITVIFGLSATQFFPLPTVAQMGQAGMLVVAIALVFGLTFLPALLAVLGNRVNRLSIRRPATAGQESFWYRFADAVMRRPWAVLVPIVIVLLVMALPMLTMRVSPGSVTIMGANAPSRIATERLETEFPANQGNTVNVIMTLPDGNALAAGSVAAEGAFARQLAGLNGVTSVDSLTTDAVSRGLGYDWSTYTGDPGQLPPPLRQLLPTQVHEGKALFQVATNLPDTDAQDLVRTIRDLPTDGARIQVGGDAALSVDLRQGIMDALPKALLFVFIGSYIILLLSFGSIFLPLKAIFMSMLSIGSAMGVVVLVFQDGWLSGLLRFTADGQLVATTPILMFCVLYGLSMDYEVLLLSRVQEEYQRTGDNRHAVAVGLARTGGLITGAAAIMIAVFGGFIAAEVTVIKGLGFGLALSVLIDATLVRCLLVPSTMRLLGSWNWWAPRPVRAVVDRLGFGHTEVPPVDAESPATRPTARPAG